MERSLAETAIAVLIAAPVLIYRCGRLRHVAAAIAIPGVDRLVFFSILYALVFLAASRTSVTAGGLVLAGSIVFAFSRLRHDLYRLDAKLR